MARTNTPRKVILAGCLAVMLLTITVAATRPAFAADQQVTVSSTDGWQATGVTLTAGQHFTVGDASGSWTVDYRNYARVGPDGYDAGTDARIYQGCKVDTRQPYGRLLARVGDDDQQLVVSAGGTFTSPADGTLLMRINDIDRCLVDNAGSVMVRVSAASTPTEATPILQTNPLWSGYATRRAPTEQVSAWWQVPSITCGPGEFSNASQWIGLGGLNDPAHADEPLVQIGIVSGCGLLNVIGVSHFGFFQLRPRDVGDHPFIGIYPVRSGDSIEAEITHVGGADYHLWLRDDAEWWSYETTQTVPGPVRPLTTAEWVVEAGQGAPFPYNWIAPRQKLTNFNTVHFENAFFNNKPLTVPDAYVRLVASEAGAAKVNVSDISQFGGQGPNFDVSWVKS